MIGQNVSHKYSPHYSKKAEAIERKTSTVFLSIASS
jgi:hypothetical protein